MSLFSRLLKLHSNKVPLEDFFTEIVAHLFETSHEVLYDWLKHLNLVETTSYRKVRIFTQESFSPLEHHHTGSRLDMVIELSDGIDQDVIFIESKVASSEGENQLSRYAETLVSEYPDARKKILLYVTRNFDPKDKDEILAKCSGASIHFEQTRWYKFYQFLKKQQGNNFLTGEIVIFMEKTGMDQDNQFTPLNVIALSNFFKAASLMEATLEGEISARFEEVVGALKGSETKRWNLLRDYELYGIEVWFNDYWWCMVGYDLSEANIIDYPDVGIYIEVYPHSNQGEIVSAIREIAQRPKWQDYFDKPEELLGIARICSLQSFLSEQDHVASIRAYFLDLIQELAEIKKQYPHLPW